MSTLSPFFERVTPRSLLLSLLLLLLLLLVVLLLLLGCLLLSVLLLRVTPRSLRRAAVASLLSLFASSVWLPVPSLALLLVPCFPPALHG